MQHWTNKERKFKTTFDKTYWTDNKNKVKTTFDKASLKPAINFFLDYCFVNSGN